MTATRAHTSGAPGRWLGIVLVLVHAGLLLWAVIGLIEWFAPAVPWPRLSNPLFTGWLLLLHWLVILSAAVLYLAGYAGRWRRTPAAMMIAYGLMAVVCAIETIGFMTHSMRYVAMVGEYAAYLLIIFALYRLPGLAERFSR